MRRGRVPLALALAAALAACRDLGGADALGTLERDRIELTAEASEPIAEIAVREGDSVQVGQALLRLDPTRIDARVAQARATRDRARAALAEQVRGPRAERIAQARARLAAGESQLAMTQRDLERGRALAARDYASQARADALANQVDEARARRDEARAELDALLRGATDEERLQTRSALEAAEAALVEVEVQRGRLDIRAPQAGAVDALPFELGERPPEGAVVVVLLASSAPYARVYVPEPLRTALAPGARAEIRVDGHPEPFAGRVRSIAQDPSFTPYFALTRDDRSRLSYLAEIDVTDEAGQRLPSGVPVEVRFTGPAHTVRDGG
jgi:HlyD family secretion protein